jgi:Uma2 family endonuclease
MATHRIPIEPDDLLEMQIPDELSGYELVDGELVPVSPASALHGWLIARVCMVLGMFVEQNGIAGRVFSDAGFILGLKRDPRRLRGPDVAFVSAETLHRQTGSAVRFARGVPDLAIEIDITSGRKPGGRQRIRDYLEAGARLVWTIEPDTRSATVWRADGSTTHVSGHDELDGEDVLPGFRLSLTALFADAPTD